MSTHNMIHNLTEVIVVSRQKRQLSQSGLYHIIFRGISRQNIFEEAAEYVKLKEIIRKVIKETSAEIYAYCFMTKGNRNIKGNDNQSLQRNVTKITPSPNYKRF